MLYETSIGFLHMRISSGDGKGVSKLIGESMFIAGLRGTVKTALVVDSGDWRAKIGFGADAFCYHRTKCF
jgi:hypothetical protein